MTTARKILMGLAMMLTVVVLLAVTVAAQMPQTTTDQAKGAGTVTTEKMSGEVVYVEGNNLVVKMANGEVRTFSNVPDSRKALIDGKEVGVRDLKPGTKLTATISKTTTPSPSGPRLWGRARSGMCGPQRHPDAAQRGEQAVQGEAGLQVHRRGQAGNRLRVEEGHDGVRGEDRRRARGGDHVGYEGRRASSSSAEGCTGASSRSSRRSSAGARGGSSASANAGPEAPQDRQPGVPHGAAGSAVVAARAPFGSSASRNPGR